MELRRPADISKLYIDFPKGKDKKFYFLWFFDLFLTEGDRIFILSVVVTSDHHSEQ